MVITFTENISKGVSTITCDVCSEVVKIERRHIAEAHS